LPPSAGLMEALFAVSMAGGTYLYLDSDQPPARRRLLLKGAGAQVVVVGEEVPPERWDLPPGTLRLMLEDRSEDAMEGTSEGYVGAPEELAYVIFTSGSTGEPKGVAVSHAAASEHCETMRGILALGTADRVLHSSSPGFDVFFEQVLPALSAGALVLILPARSLDPGTLSVACAAQRITVADLPTALWRQWVSAAEGGRLGSADLRVVITGGEPMPEDALAAWRRLVPEPPLLVNAYGPTEAVITATSACPGASGGVTIGRPVGRRRVYVAGPELAPVPIGAAGELCLAGGPLARGYLGDPVATAQRFVPDCFGSEPGSRLYRTGDLGRWLPAGELEYSGRIDGQVKLRGFRIELGEVESALTAHPAVGAAAVILRDGGSERPRLAAFVTSADGGVDLQALRDHLLGRLPAYMVPSEWSVLSELPVTSSGKVDRRNLARTESGAAGLASPYVPPRDALELALVELWSELLGRTPVGVRDDFFALGGHSLLAIRLATRLERLTGRRLPIAALFQAPTVEDLARRVREGEDDGHGSLVVFRRTGDRPPLVFVHAAGGHVFPYAELARHLGPSQPFFAFQAAGLGEEGLPEPTIPRLAERYLAELRTVQPDGPFILGGWSVGGAVAFEMGRRLQEMGEALPAVVLLDTRLPPPPDGRAAEDDLNLLRHLALDLGIEPGPGAPVAALRSLDAAEGLALLVELGRAQGALPPEMSPEDLGHLFDLFRDHSRAFLRWRPEPYMGPVALVCPEATFTELPDPALPWRPLVPAGLRTVRVPGDHFTMVRQPHVPALAEALAGLFPTQSDQEGQGP
ncbi:MAG TPA: amino acid adenylation domain-containing protein, partial [Thermoanaerobaculia bacterium]|nr:amino acid adenylation domain-containing protein [Thermoanaerobaculia bacterium]